MKIFLALFLLSLCEAQDKPKTIPDKLSDAEYKNWIKELMPTIIANNVHDFEDPNEKGKEVRCDIHSELMRQALEKEFHGLILLRYLIPEAGQGPINAKIVRSLLKLSGIKSLCNTFKNLACGPSPTVHDQGSCQCAKNVERFLRFKAMFHREEDTCVISEGQMCAPEAMVSMVNHDLIYGTYPNIRLACAKGTPCLIRETGKPCDALGLMEELGRIGELHNTPETDVAYKLAKAAEGICICTAGGCKFQQSIALSLFCIVLFIINFYQIF